MRNYRNFYFLPLLFSSMVTARDKPNVIIFLADDFGWKDLGCYGSSYYETPVTDRLAKEGVRFTNAYSACTVCSPSRAALMTGKYPARLHITDWIPGHRMEKEKLTVPDWTMFLDPEELTIAEILRANGYKTACIGKWHLGEDSIYWPEFQGFDINIGGYSKGSPKSYFSPYSNPRLADGPDREYLTDRLAEESVGFIRKHQNQPFFLYLSHYAVHTPFQAKMEMVEKYRMKTNPDNKRPNPVYAAMVESMDQSLGLILKELMELGLDSNTYIFFLSDNGGLCPQATSNYPLREGKGTPYEGGVRIPLIVMGPDIPKGKVVEEPVITMDVFSTILDIVRVQQNESSVDGVSLLPVIKGEKGRTSRPLFWHYPHYHTQGAKPYSALRLDNWKFYYFYEDGRHEMYNLDLDVSEKVNVIHLYPEEASLHNRLLQNWLKETGAQYPVPNLNYQPTRDDLKKGNK